MKTRIRHKTAVAAIVCSSAIGTLVPAQNPPQPPSTPSVRQAEAKGEETKSTRVQTLLATAQALERQYDWNEARRTYQSVLDLQPQQSDAKEGFSRTGTIIRAILVFERRIEEARVQSERGNFQVAIAALDQAMLAKPTDLKLNPEQVELMRMLKRHAHGEARKG